MHFEKDENYNFITPYTPIETALTIQEIVEYYICLHARISTIIISTISSLDIVRDNFATINDIKQNKYTIPETTRLRYNLSTSNFQFYETTEQTYINCSAIKNFTSEFPTSVYVDFFQAVYYLDVFLYRFMEDVFKSKTVLTGKFQYFNEYITKCIFEQKL